ncbi:transposable element Tc3 transposase [Trichonephila clavipes]|nr:transposable element Tc3 transposase [Trichonephila clavipes]
MIHWNPFLGVFIKRQESGQKQRTVVDAVVEAIGVIETSHYRLGGLMAWAGISIGRRADLHIIRNGNLMAKRYANDILRPQVVLYDTAIGDCFLLMVDNARNPTAHLVEHCLKAETRSLSSLTVREMEIVLLEEWNSISQSLTGNLIAPMLNRYEAVLAVQGDHTPY